MSPLFEEWAGRLRLAGPAAADDEGFELASYYELRFERPVRIAMDAAALDLAVASIGNTALDIWPEDDEQTAAVKLLLVHLEEKLDLKPADSNVLTLTPTGFTWMR